ncbi:VWA domain-containing protein [Aquibium sp. ELW1220]|uniref:vWA domain-containing protein n=1 Tax=Aquibium sp. ELW1220 TaxID=2976766 RepID=UPI0025AFE023|nr:VWA domain-containing protein [Aquibium sp. ELW1220]MDN2580364.1 VWA domain-containing protein [Aquibium sp. ELW1220]
MARDELDILRDQRAPRPDEAAKRRALSAAMQAFDENSSQAPQGSARPQRPSTRTTSFWSRIMDRRLLSTPAIASILALPAAGFAAYVLVNENPFGRQGPFVDSRVEQGPAQKTAAPAEPAPAAAPAAEREEAARDLALGGEAAEADRSFDAAPLAAAPMTAAPPPEAPARLMTREAAPGARAASQPFPPAVLPAPVDALPLAEENRDRIEAFDTNPVRSALENPVSTFSIDVDTASYAFVRSSLKSGVLPQADTVRVEEMINYFPYDWPGPQDAATPFNTTVSVMPTPWNGQTKLMHVAIKGYDLQPAERPASNLVFLIDTSGSMNQPDKLPLLKNAFRLLVDRLSEKDSVAIVAYAGSAGTVLEPTPGSEKEKILAALDRLDAGGSTAGEEGLRQAYRLAQESFIEGGVNRVMLATDGDFNVGQSSDEELKRLIEAKRASGVFLSVFGFGRGNYNDQMMQTIAQNGNGTAAYIDTLAEAEKTLVQEASSTLFTIAGDVKIQVEFNPATVAEYRLIGYETRALAREDFNNDRVDAGDIGSGHSVTAIYEITPKGSPAQMIDDLRYGEAKTDNATGIAHGDEYAFVKIRYKLPQEDVSTLIETPVTAASEIAGFDAASDDQRFSVAVAAFGQKLRGADQTAGLGYDRIIDIATAARGADPFGYRAEFLQLVRLASALDARR